MNIRTILSVKDRRIVLEKSLGVSLKNIGTYSLDENTASQKNCENMIGVAQIPLGIAGPLKINEKDYFVPLATTEGALVASVNRGCKAITQSDGAFSTTERVGITRGPVFNVRNISEIKKVQNWLSTHFKLLQKTAATTSSHLNLTRYEVASASPYVFMRFYFDTGDAMGMNMATIATEKLVTLVEKETGIQCISIAGNFDIDKKPAWINVLNGRGWSARADVVLKEEVLTKILKTTAQKIYDVWLAKCMVGSSLSGSMGFNAQHANVVAALFIATGQDPAHVVEGSSGITTVEKRNEDLYMSVYLPSLMVGTVGGGTSMSTQKEALEIVGVSGSGKVEEFARVVGGAVLAGEISLLASLAEGSLVRAHKMLARGKTKSEIRSSKHAINSKS